MSKPEGPINQVISSLRRLVPENEKIVIACSGGADSMALLFCAQKTGHKLVVVHALHDMRPLEEASKDRDLVQKYCKENSLPFREVLVEVKKYTNPSEETYRILRQSQIRTVGNQEKTFYTATGHHADDQLETMLMKLGRGSGLRGFSGIAEKHKHNDYITVRPMLSISKEDIYEICKQNNVPFNEDETNKDTKYTRNAIRNLIVPVLKEVFPDCARKSHEAACVFADAQKLADDSLHDLKKHEVFNLVYDPNDKWGGKGTCLTIPIEALLLANNITIYEWLRYAFAKLNDTPTYVSYDSLNREMVEQVIKAIRSRSSKKFKWSGNVAIHVNKREVRFIIFNDRNE